MTDQSSQAQFQMVLLTVVGQAFGAAGYHLEERPIQWASGKFRFTRLLDTGLQAHIDFQLLTYVDSEWASGMPSRFKVTLSRSDTVRRDLSALVVDDFKVAILPTADHWWTFTRMDELGQALAEAGHLIVGYGIPWLAGDLEPPSNEHVSGF